MRTSCPICKSRSHKILKTMRFAIPEYFHLPNQYDVVVCADCGFCFAATEAAMEDYEHYYEVCNFYSGVPEESEGKLMLDQKLAGLVEKVVSPEDSLLDIGFGAGNLLRLLKQKGFHNIFGLDPSEDSVARIREEGITAYLGSVFDEPDGSLRRRFDCVLLIAVLEHLLYPESSVRHISDYLKEGGKLIISVPNYADLFDDCSLIANHFNQEHINYFSPVSLDNLLNANGFYKMENSDANVGDMGTEVLAVYCYTSNKRSFERVKDDVCHKSIAEFFKRNDNLEKAIDEEILSSNLYASSLCTRGGSVQCENVSLLKTHASEHEYKRPVYIWGTGAYTMWLLTNTLVGKLNIKAFIDNNPTRVGKELDGKRIISPDEIEPDIPIIVCVMKCPEKVADQIERSGITNPYYLLRGTHREGV